MSKDSAHFQPSMSVKELLIELLHQVDAFVCVRVPFLVEHHPYQPKGDAFVNDAEPQDVDGGCANIPLHTVYREHPEFQDYAIQATTNSAMTA